MISCTGSASVVLMLLPHNAAYLEIHLHELVGPLDQECSAHVEMES